MGKALEGVRVLDMTHVQSGPTSTQILAFFGADVIKVEKPGEGDPTRGQLRDIPGVDSLYFTMLNGNKRSITLNPKTEAGGKIFARLIETCDVMVVVMTPRAESSVMVNTEIDYARSRGKPLVPLLLEGDEPMFVLRLAQYADVRGGALPDAAFIASLGEPARVADQPQRAREAR